MPLDEENAGVKLPSAFQSLSAPTSNTISKTVETNPNIANHLYGYRSNFNVNEEKAKYQQQKQQESSSSILQSPSIHQQNHRQPYHQSLHNKPRNNERFTENNNHKYNFRADSSGGWCEICDRSFKTQQQLDRHLSEHEKCCFDGCQYEAHSTLLKKHIEAQHNSGLFQRMGAIETEEDIEKWREERRKRYPTRANIETRQLAQEQRSKRGERIVEPNNRFGKNRDRRSANEGNFNNKKEQNKSFAKDKKKRPRKRRNNKTKNIAASQVRENKDGSATENNTENVNTEIVRFAGISHMAPSTESISNVEPEKKSNSLTALVGLYGDNTSDDDSDGGPEEVAVTKSDDTPLASQLQVKNMNTEEQTNPPVEETCAENEIHELDLTEINATTSSSMKIDCNSDDDEPPEVQSISHEPFEENGMIENKAIDTEADCKRRNDQQSRQHEPKPKIPKKQSVFDMTKKIRHQNSLLEKLLQKDIRHERNVLLQCVRYVVENDFFGVGQPTKQ